MDGLFINKIAGAVLGTFLILFVVNEVSHVLYHPHELEELAYAVEIPEDGGGPAKVEGPTDYGKLLREASVAAGERATAKCVSCHSFNKGGPTITGPNLWDVVGRAAGSVDGFGYTAAMKSAGFAWDYEHLSHFLENPRAYVSGTAMTFAGLRKEGERMDVIAYLRTLSDDPKALPDPLPEPVAETETGEEAVAEPAEGAAG